LCSFLRKPVNQQLWGNPFREGEDRRKTKYANEKKIRVIQLYLENVGLRSIERLKKVSATTIINWIKKMGEIIKKKGHD
jgi:transposase-like protein